MKPILLEIVARTLTSFGQCRSCSLVFEEAGLREKIEENTFREYPADLVEESKRLYTWIEELKRLYRHRLFIRVIDAKSFFGFYKSLRHGIRRYPGFIIEGKETCTGWDREKLETLLDKYVRQDARACFQPG
jgi:hypothetical protein